jgi:flagellar biogenesis protein FliO
LLLVIAAGATGYASASPGATGYASAPPRRDNSIPLGPPGHTPGGPETTRTIDRLPSLGPMASGLAIVLGLFLAAAWALRRAAPKSATVLPGEVVEVLGRAPLAGRQQMHLLRCGKKLLLVSVTPTGAETLTEVTDPLEVDRLCGLCRQAHPRSATATFRQVFQQLGAGSEDRHV